MRSRNCKALPVAYLGPFKLQPVDGFMKAETCNCSFLVINYSSCNTVVLDRKFVCVYITQQ